MSRTTTSQKCIGLLTCACVVVAMTAQNDLVVGMAQLWVMAGLLVFGVLRMVE